MTSLHLPYGELLPAPSMSDLLRLYDQRVRDGGDRVVWRRSLVDHEQCLQLETDLCVGGKVATTVERFKTTQIERDGWRIGAIAFEPPDSSHERWRRLLVRDAHIQLGALRRFDPCDRRLASLGIPEDIGSNAWVAAGYEGKTILIPSLALLVAIAFPSMPVWQRLRHPLSMDLVCRRSPSDPQKIEIARDAVGGPTLKLHYAGLYTLAFWLEEHRLASLHRALEGFGGQGWALTMPDRPEHLNMAFDGYESDELIVVQRIRQLHSARFFPGDWGRVVRLNHDGKVADAVAFNPVMSYSERRGLASHRTGARPGRG